MRKWEVCKVISTTKTIIPMANMEDCFERGHVELSYNSRFILIELEIKVWWQVESQHFHIEPHLSKKSSMVTKMFYDKLKKYSMLIPNIYDTPSNLYDFR